MMIARLQRDIKCGPLCSLSGTSKGHHFRVGAAIPFVAPLANESQLIIDQHRPDTWIRFDPSLSSAGQSQCPLHYGDIIRKLKSGRE